MLSKLWVKDDLSFTPSFPICVLVEPGIVIIAGLDAFIGVKWNAAVDLLNLVEQTSWLLLYHEFQRQNYGYETLVVIAFLFTLSAEDIKMGHLQKSLCKLNIQENRPVHT